MPIAQNGKIYLPICRLERYFSDKTRFCTVTRCFVNIIVENRHFDPFWDPKSHFYNSRSIPIAQNGNIYLPICRVEIYLSDKTRFCTDIRCFVEIIVEDRKFDPF